MLLPWHPNSIRNDNCPTCTKHCTWYEEVSWPWWRCACFVRRKLSSLAWDHIMFQCKFIAFIVWPYSKRHIQRSIYLPVDYQVLPHIPGTSAVGRVTSSGTLVPGNMYKERTRSRWTKSHLYACIHRHRYIGLFTFRRWPPLDFAHVQPVASSHGNEVILWFPYRTVGMNALPLVPGTPVGWCTQLCRAKYKVPGTRYSMLDT